VWKQRRSRCEVKRQRERKIDGRQHEVEHRRCGIAERMSLGEADNDHGQQEKRGRQDDKAITLLTKPPPRRAPRGPPTPDQYQRRKREKAKVAVARNVTPSNTQCTRRVTRRAYVSMPVGAPSSTGAYPHSDAGSGIDALNVGHPSLSGRAS
jgi:hypothetical protein